MEILDEVELELRAIKLFEDERRSPMLLNEDPCKGCGHRRVFIGRITYNCEGREKSCFKWREYHAQRELLGKVVEWLEEFRTVKNSNLVELSIPRHEWDKLKELNDG